MSGKKGFLFTTAALFIVAAIVLLSMSNNRQYTRTLTQSDRIETMNTYLQNLEQDLPRAAYIAGFRGLIGLEEHISEKGLYTTNFDTDFQSVFTNGTINGTFYTIMQDSTFNDFAARFKAVSASQGIVTNISVLSVKAYQKDPWYVTVNFTVQIYLADSANTALFNYTKNITAEVPIDGIKDPLHTVGTNGRLPRTFHQSNLTIPYITAANDTTNLQLLVNNSLYITSPNAPSFLQRFVGNFSASPFGVESLVNIKDIRAQELNITGCKSVVDYIYFGSTNTNPNNFVVNMDINDFWLDNAHLADFNAAGKTTGIASCP